MKLETIVVAAALSLSSTFSLAQMGGASGGGATVPEISGPAVNGGGGVVSPNDRRESGTVGMSSRDPNGGNPNGNAGGPTSLSGTGSSTYGGVGSPGTTSGR